MTDNVWRTSPASTTKTLPIHCPLPPRSWSVHSKASSASVCAIVQAPHTISEHSCRTLASPVCSLILQRGASQCIRLRGSFNVEWAVRPPWRSVAAIPDEPTTIAILDYWRLSAKSKLMTHVFPVPPNASRKIIPTNFFSIRSNTAMYAALGSITSSGWFIKTYVSSSFTS
jgi:hypothetical protein